MKNKIKAFTLVEAVVSLSILIVVLGLVVGVVISTSSITNKQKYEASCQTEFENAKNLVEEFLTTYSASEFTLSIVNQKLVVQNNFEEFNLEFDENSKILSAQIKDFALSQTQNKNLEFNFLTKIQFEVQNNIVKSQYFFKNFPTYVNLTKFGAF